MVEKIVKLRKVYFNPLSLEVQLKAKGINVKILRVEKIGREGYNIVFESDLSEIAFENASQTIFNMLKKGRWKIER